MAEDLSARVYPDSHSVYGDRIPDGGLSHNEEPDKDVNLIPGLPTPIATAAAEAPSLEPLGTRQPLKRALSSISVESAALLPRESTGKPDSVHDFAATVEGIHFWNCVRLVLAALERPEHSPSEIELQRVHLLQDICNSQDVFCLALHQVYCLSSLSSPGCVTTPGLTVDNDGWVEVIKGLLIDNRSLSEDYLTFFAQFPFPWDRMIQNKDYLVMLEQVGHTLSLISQRWISFEHEVRLRRYPPLIEELIVHFGMISPVLQSVVFTAFIRRLYGPQNEPFFKACEALFEQNRRRHESRFADFRNPVPQDVIQKENEGLISGYMARVESISQRLHHLGWYYVRRRRTIELINRLDWHGWYFISDNVKSLSLRQAFSHWRLHSSR